MSKLHQSTLVLAIVITCVWAFASESKAQDTRTWMQPLGGFFEVASNWSDTMTPDSNDGALFNLEETYSVVWDGITGDRVNNRLEVSGGNVTFAADAGGNQTYFLTGPGASQAAIIRNGATLNVGQADSGIMNVVAGGLLSVSSRDSPIRRGQLNISHGSTVSAGSLQTSVNSDITVNSGGQLILDPGSQSFLEGELLSIRGAGSAFAAGELLISSSLGTGPGITDIVVENGATFRADIIETEFGSTRFNVGGAGSTMTVDSFIMSDGPESTTRIDVTGSANLTAHQIILGKDINIDAGRDVVFVEGAGSSLDVSRIDIGGSGDGSLSVSNGATADLDVIFIGFGNNGVGTLSVSEASQLNTNILNIGGRSGEGSVSVRNSQIDADRIDVSGNGRFSVDSSFGEPLSVINTQRLRFEGGFFNLDRGIVNVLSSFETLELSGETQVSDLNLSLDAQLHVAGKVVFGEGKIIRVSDSAGLSASRVTNDGDLQVSADLTLGSVDYHDGFDGDGFLQISDSSLTLLDRGFVELGSETMLSNGNLNAANGIALGNAKVIEGYGSLNGRIAASTGSAIYASGGDLTLGDAARVAGFASQGELYVGDNVVRMMDANQAQLGTYTELGTGSSGGTLNVANGAILDFGDNLVGVGRVENGDFRETAIINNGAMIGNSVIDRLVVTGYVKGIGTFENVQFDGTFAPGLSPTITRGTNFFFGDTSTLEMEIGGLVPGDEHDAIWASELMSLDGTLEILFLNGFDSSLGESFDLFNWGSIEGSFDDYVLPELATGLRWDTGDLYSTGSLKISAVPEPSAFALLSLVFIGFTTRRRTK